MVKRSPPGVLQAPVWAVDGGQHRWAILFAGLVWTFVHSCGGGADPMYRQLTAEPPAYDWQADTVEPTDRFEIRVAGEPELSGEFTVSGRGTINYPWVGELQVQGLNCDEVSALIGDALRQGYLRDPSVTCQITEINSRKVDVLGEVHRPGTFVYEESMSVVRAIARAGGFTEDAAPNRTNVLRLIDGVETRISIPVDDILSGNAPNFVLQPGDTVFVPRYTLIP
ncbi:MAG: polysaccharide export protein [Bradymonadales bacterium]|nr:polysaccharide export protein [Bradymonadales bacterium]